MQKKEENALLFFSFFFFFLHYINLYHRIRRLRLYCCCFDSEATCFACTLLIPTIAANEFARSTITRLEIRARFKHGKVLVFEQI